MLGSVMYILYVEYLQCFIWLVLSGHCGIIARFTQTLAVLLTLMVGGLS